MNWFKRSKLTSLTPTIRLKDVQQTFLRLLAEGSIHGERTRAIVLALLYSLLFAFVALAGYLLPGGLTDWFGADFPTGAVTLLTGAAALYELLIWIVISLIARRDRPFPPSLSITNTLLETLPPTGLLVILSMVYDSSLVLGSTISMIYMLYILLSITRLSGWLSFFTGALTAGEYLLLILLFPNTVSVAQLIGTLAILVVAGLLAAFVTRQIRRRAAHALDALNRRNRVAGIFELHISQKTIDLLNAQQIDGLPPAKRYVAVMLVDVASFISYAATNPPDVVVDYLDTLYDRYFTIVREHQGIIFKFLGSGFFVVFSPPKCESYTACREQAVNAATEILAWTKDQTALAGLPPTRLGIGIHSGEVQTGLVAEGDLTVSDQMLATVALIRQQTDKVGAQILVSADVWGAVQETRTDGKMISPLKDTVGGTTLGLYRLGD